MVTLQATGLLIEDRGVKLPGLRAARERAILTQAELAELAGISRATVMRIEAGKIEPHPRTIRKLAAALGVKPRELLRAPERE